MERNRTLNITVIIFFLRVIDVVVKFFRLIFGERKAVRPLFDMIIINAAVVTLLLRTAA